MTQTPPTAPSFWDGYDLSQTFDPVFAATQLGNVLSALGTVAGLDPLSDAPVIDDGMEEQGAQPLTGEAVQPFSGDAPITGGFGEDRDGHVHAGIDFGVPANTAILSMQPGTVTQVVGEGDSGGYGNEVVVDHGNGLSTRYAHLTAASVAVGQKVAAGEQLGLSGSTGQSTGPHLHFETMLNGQAVDPTPYLAGGGAIVGQAVTEPAAGTEEPQSADIAETPSVTVLTDDQAVDPITQAELTRGKRPAKAKAGKVGSMTGADTDPGAVGAFLNATKQHESGGDYTIRNQSGLSNAAGAYQFLGSTWKGLGGSTESAAEASPAEQDAIARKYAMSLFEQFGSWRLVAAAWFGGPSIAAQIAAGRDPGAPSGQGSYIAYADKIASMMAGGK